MCGRFTLYSPAATIATLFDLEMSTVDTPPLPPRYNIAPTQPVAIVRVKPGNPEREWALTKWGFVPSWSKDPTIGAKMINARSETVAEKPSFRAAFKRRRCLVPTDGFYEWQKPPSGSTSKRKQPYYIGMADSQPFAVAGLWESWAGTDGSVLETCTLLTTTPNALMEPIHNRMPVIIEPDEYDDWLGDGRDADRTYQDHLRHLMRPYPAERMQAYPVDTYVSNARNEGATCIERLS